jgi:hypothetical protein
MDKRGILLGLDDELGCEEALGLVLRDVGAVDDVGDELWAEGKAQVVAIDVAGLVLVDDKEIVPLFADGDVGVFADLDVSVGAQDEEAAVSPGTEAIGGEPIETNVAKATVAATR